MSTRNRIGSENLMVEWGHGGVLAWTVTWKDGIEWAPNNPLTSRGKQVLLNGFGLGALVDELPLGVMTTTSPDVLEGMASELSTGVLASFGIAQPAAPIAA